MRRLALLVTVVLAAGCGSAEDSAAPGQEPAQPPPATTVGTTTAATTTEAEPAPEPTVVSVYFLRDGQIAAARRELEPTQAVARAALEALAAGPTAAERAAGLSTSVPGELPIERLAIADGTAHVDFPAATGCPSLAQVVYTLTQFPTVERVTGNCIPESAYGAGLTRAALEQVTPPIFVETPAIGETVTSPLRLAGTANTYEATFMVELADSTGKVVAKRFATATSGSGERGTFDVELPFSVDAPGGTLTVYESSAEDGSRIHVVEIPLDLRPS